MGKTTASASRGARRRARVPPRPPGRPSSPRCPSRPGHPRRPPGHDELHGHDHHRDHRRVDGDQLGPGEAGAASRRISGGSRSAAHGMAVMSDGTEPRPVVIRPGANCARTPPGVSGPPPARPLPLRGERKSSPQAHDAGRSGGTMGPGCDRRSRASTEVFPMARLARWCFKHRWRVVAAWLLALVAIAGASAAAGTDFTTNLACRAPTRRRRPPCWPRTSPPRPARATRW